MECKNDTEHTFILTDLFEVVCSACGVTNGFQQKPEKRVDSNNYVRLFKSYYCDKEYFFEHLKIVRGDLLWNNLYGPASRFELMHILNAQCHLNEQPPIWKDIAHCIKHNTSYAIDPTILYIPQFFNEYLIIPEEINLVFELFSSSLKNINRIYNLYPMFLLYKTKEMKNEDITYVPLKFSHNTFHKNERLWDSLYYKLQDIFFPTIYKDDRLDPWHDLQPWSPGGQLSPNLTYHPEGTMQNMDFLRMTS